MSREQFDAFLTAVREDPDLQQQLSQGDHQQVLNGLLKAASDKGFDISADDFSAAGLNLKTSASKLSDGELDAVNGAGMANDPTFVTFTGKVMPPVSLTQLLALIGKQ